MTLKLEKVLAALTLLTAIAYCLGWLKTFYYFYEFRIFLGSLDFTPQDYLFESWYAVENVLFFLLLSWVVAICPRWWTIAVGLLYLGVPLATHHAFEYVDHSMVAAWLVNHEHSVLKFVPFLLLLLVLALGPQVRARFTQMTWPYSSFLLVVYFLVALAWSISLAKHIGSADALNVLWKPDQHLPKVHVHVSENASDFRELAGAEGLYLLSATPNRYVVWDTRGFHFGLDSPESGPFRVFIVPRDKIAWIETSKQIEVQPGDLFF